jgi:hypothetical protein
MDVPFMSSMSCNECRSRHIKTIHRDSLRLRIEEPDHKLRSLSELALALNRAAEFASHQIVDDMQTQTAPALPTLRGEKGFKDFA